MLKQVKIGTKIIGGFLLIAAIAAALGGYSILKLRDINHQYSAGWNDNSRSLQAVGSLSASLQKLRVGIRDFVNADNDAERQAAEEALKKSREAWDKSVVEFSKTDLSDQEKQILPEVQRSWDDYNRMVNEAMQKARGGNRAGAELLLSNHQLASDLAAGVDSLVSAENDISSKSSAQLSAQADATAWSVAIAVLLATIVALVIGFSLMLAITRPLRELMTVAQALAEGDVNKQMTYQSGDELGQLADSFRAVMATIRSRSDATQKMAAGDLSVQVVPKSEHDVLAAGLRKCLEVLNDLIRQMANMSQQHDAGEIDAQIDARKFEGDYRKVAQGINDMVAGHIAVKKKAMACVAEFGTGNFEAPLEKFPGKKAFINDTIEQLRSNLKTLIAEMNRMSAEHDRGDIDVSIPVEKFEGDYRKMAQGINGMVAGHITVKKKAMACIAEFGKGNFEAPACRRLAWPLS